MEQEMSLIDPGLLPPILTWDSSAWRELNIFVIL